MTHTLLCFVVHTDLSPRWSVDIVTVRKNWTISMFISVKVRISKIKMLTNFSHLGSF
jgi:hypothetical protein